MRTRDLLDRVGLGGASVDARFTWSIVLIACALYALAFFAFYPNAITNDDEAAYLRHARIMLEGRASTVPKLDALDGETVDHVVSKYPVGTASMMVPFVAVAGWRGAFCVPFLCLMAGVLITGRWLQEQGYSPLWALLVLGYPPALVMGRVAMSDVPSFAVVTLGLWFFWRGLDRGWGYWMASGFIAGISMVWRETNAVVFAPFFAGTLLRRERACWAIIVGGVAGVAVRLLSSTFMFGDPFFYKAPYIVDFSALLERLPLYLLALLVFVPGGLLLVLLYRGRRWPELTVSVTLFVLLYVIQEYFMWGTSPLKRMVLTPRYMLPILPLMALAAAEVLPRLWRRLVAASAAPRRALLETALVGVLALWIGGVAVAAVVVHPMFAAWSASQARISDAIAANTDLSGVVVTNLPLTRKFLRELDRKYLPVSLERVPPAEALDITTDLATRYGAFDIVLLDRSDGPLGLEQTRQNAEYIASIGPLKPVIVFDREMSSTDHLRVWRVDYAPPP